MVPIVLVAMNVVYALSAYPPACCPTASIARIARGGLVMLAGADLALALMPNLGGVAIGVALWACNGIYARPVCRVGRRRRARRIARNGVRVFQFADGLAMLAASVIAGTLWDAYGPAGTFLAGLVFALVTLFGLLSMSGEISSVAGE